MQKDKTKIFYVWKELFLKKSYILITMIISVLFYSLNAIISNISEIKRIFSEYDFLFSLKLLALNISGFHYRLLTHSLISLIIISVLFGFLFSLITYKTKNIKKNSGKKTGVLATIGIFLGVLAPGCAACGVGIASILGLGAFVTFLPYDGLELSILAIILLLFAIHTVSKTLLQQNVCKVIDNHQEPDRKK